MSDDYLITTAYARDVLTDLEAELLKRLERSIIFGPEQKAPVLWPGLFCVPLIAQRVVPLLQFGQALGTVGRILAV